MRPTITILLVDDHAIVRQGCRLLLQEAGFTIAGEAASGEDAYASCLRHPPRVVIVDLAMPGMGGLEAIRRIRARFAESAVVVFTMHDDPMIATRALKAGATAFVTKTSAPRDLVEAVRRAGQGGVLSEPGHRAGHRALQPRHAEERAHRADRTRVRDLPHARRGQGVCADRGDRRGARLQGKRRESCCEGPSALSATSGPARAATRDEDAITQWRTDAWRTLLMCERQSIRVHNRGGRSNQSRPASD